MRPSGTGCAVGSTGGGVVLGAMVVRAVVLGAVMAGVGIVCPAAASGIANAHSPAPVRKRLILIS